MSRRPRERNIEAINSLTHVASRTYDDATLMARLSDIEQSLKAAAITDVKRLKELAVERLMDVNCSLEEAHHRYLSNQREMRLHELSMHGLYALLGPQRVGEMIQADVNHEWWPETDLSTDVVDLRKHAALWEHIAHYLRVVPEAQAAEILTFFRCMGIKTTRQAIEGAIRLHPKVFGVRKRGRERYFYRKDEA